MRKFLISIGISAIVALGATSAARSDYRVLGDPPTDYETYGDVAFDANCMRWNWQQKSWYDICTHPHPPLAWSRR